MHTRIHPNTRTKVHTHIHTNGSAPTRFCSFSLLFSLSLHVSTISVLSLFKLFSDVPLTLHHFKANFCHPQEFPFIYLSRWCVPRLMIEIHFLQLTWVAFIHISHLIFAFSSWGRLAFKRNIFTKLHKGSLNLGRMNRKAGSNHWFQAYKYKKASSWAKKCDTWTIKTFA